LSVAWNTWVSNTFTCWYLRMRASTAAPGIVRSLSPGVFFRKPVFSMDVTTIVVIPLR